MSETTTRRRNTTTAVDPLAAALRRALRDERDPALRTWIRALLRGDAPARRKGASA